MNTDDEILRLDELIKQARRQGKEMSGRVACRVVSIVEELAGKIIEERKDDDRS